MSTRQFTDFVLWLPRTELSNDHAVFVSYNYLVLDITPFQPRCERNHRSRAPPCSLILYSNVPLPRERLSSRPKVHNLLKYVQAERAGKKLSLSAASFGPSHSPWVEANKDRTCS